MTRRHALTLCSQQIRAIILAPSYTFSITRLTASRLASHLPNHPSSSLTRAGAEALVERFIAGGWLEVSKCVPLTKALPADRIAVADFSPAPAHRHKKRLSLACRSTAELEGYLEKEFPPGIDDDEDEDDGRPRILKCSVCKAIATKVRFCRRLGPTLNALADLRLLPSVQSQGKLCPSCPIDQPTAVHNHCLHKLLHRASAATSGSRGARHVHCPAQGEGVIWSEDGVAVDGELEVSWTELGEEAAGERDEAYVPPSKGGRSQKASSSRSKGKGKGKRTRTESDLESEDDDDDGDSEAARSKDTRQSSRISKSSSPVKKAVKGAKRESALLFRHSRIRPARR